MSHWTGQRLGDYQLERLLGRGATGEVFEARHAQTDQLVAIKVIYPNFAADPDFQARFRRQVKFAKELDHPHIVAVLDDGEDRGRLYLVMELMQDGSLRTLLERRATQPWPLALGIELVRQAADALAYVHAKGIVHRDIKPENMLLRRIAVEADADERPLVQLPDPPNGAVPEAEGYILKLSDFELARLEKSTTRLTKTRQEIGTLDYRSPEQFRDPRKVDGRSDVYALGVVFYEVATGTLPFQIESLEDALNKHLHEDPPLPRDVNPDLPVELEKIVLDCLAKDPGARLTSAELTQILQTLLNESTLSLSDQSAPAPRALPDAEGVDYIDVSVDNRTLRLTPDRPATAIVTVTNRGSMVDHFTLSVEGIPETWVTVPDRTAELNPDKQASAPISIAVPRSPDSYADDYQVTIRAHSSNTQEDFGATKAIWTVAPFAGNDLRIDPKEAGGRRQATYTLALRNDGNVPASYRLRGEDTRNALTYEFTRDGVPLALSSDGMQLDPNEAVSLELTVRAQRRWLGREKTHPFAVNLNEIAPAKPVEAYFVQWPIIPTWIVALLGGLLLILMFLLFSPPIIWDVRVDPPRPAPDTAFTVSWLGFNARHVMITTPISGTFEAPLVRFGYGYQQQTFGGLIKPDKFTLAGVNWLGRPGGEVPVPIDLDLEKPRIKQFAASIISGTQTISGTTIGIVNVPGWNEAITLTWEIERARFYLITVKGEGVDNRTRNARDTIQLSAPKASQKYELVVTDTDGKPQATREVRIDVAEPQCNVNSGQEGEILLRIAPYAISQSIATLSEGTILKPIERVADRQTPDKQWVKVAGSDQIGWVEDGFDSV